MRRMAIRAILALMAMIAGSGVQATGCTSALVGATRGEGGRWLLWKHRDSGHPDNYVKNFEATDSTLAYVGLFNAADKSAREVWIGYNSAGFAVMNTATYNIPAPAKNWQDREGLIMTEALQRCRTIEDFHRLLAEYSGPRGVQANFGAFDANGNGAYFETSNESVIVYPLDTCGISTRTNYSLSGGKQKRLGLSRHIAEKHLLDSVMNTSTPWSSPGYIAAEDLIETLSRSLYLPEAGIDLLDGTASRRPDTGDVISRRSSSASVVIEGPLPGEDPAQTMIMWTAIGFPTLSVVEAATLESVPRNLLPATAKGHSILCDSANILRSEAFLPSRRQASDSKARYDFNLPLLRREIPLRRALSAPRYAPAREAIRKTASPTQNRPE